FPLTGSKSAGPFSPDGTRVAAVHNDGYIHLWDWKRGFDMGPIGGRSDAGHPRAFSQTGELLALALGNGDIQLWRLSSPAILVRTLTGDGNGISKMHFFAKGSERLVALSESREGGEYYCRMYNIAEQSPPILLHTIAPNTWLLWTQDQCFNVSPNGQF